MVYCWASLLYTCYTGENGSDEKMAALQNTTHQQASQSYHIHSSTHLRQVVVNGSGKPCALASFSTELFQNVTRLVYRPNTHANYTKLGSFTRWRHRLLDASAAIIWPWTLTFWPQNLISSSLPQDAPMIKSLAKIHQ